MSKITDLTNTIWVVPAGWSATAGYGRFYDIEYDIIYSDGIEDINYCRALFIGFSGPPNFENNEYDSFTKSTSNTIITWSYGSRITPADSFTITFTGGTDVTNTSLISWLEANGECQNPPTPKVTITYKDTTILAEPGKIITLHLADKKLTEDMVITTPEEEVVEEWDGSYVVSGGELIDFTIGSKSYQAEEGMTWQEWVESEYNTDGYVVSYSYIKTQGTAGISVQYDTVNVETTDIIIADRVYTHANNHSGGSGN